jgi:hypothetical protein
MYSRAKVMLIYEFIHVLFPSSDENGYERSGRRSEEVTCSYFVRRLALTPSLPIHKYTPASSERAMSITHIGRTHAKPHIPDDIH